jgi:diaminopimelate epimerase
MTTTPASALVTNLFAKGHGTENDFVILPDPDGRLDLSAQDVIRLCHRRSGLGADGVLRAVRTAAEPEAAAMAASAEWFMDYRNCDGTRGAMCGNGIRLLARYLVDAGHCTPGPLAIATRAGVRHVHVPTRAADFRGPVSVTMGHPRLPGPNGIEVTVGRRHWPATHIDMGNPHAVAFVDDLAHAADLLTPPTVTPAHAYPQGVTVEFVTVLGPRHLALRVHERGVGETRACGTGACAAVAALRARDGQQQPGDYLVDAPGGRLHIRVRPGGGMELTGPAAIVAQGALTLRSAHDPRASERNEHEKATAS